MFECLADARKGGLFGEGFEPGPRSAAGGGGAAFLTPCRGEVDQGCPPHSSSGPPGQRSRPQAEPQAHWLCETLRPASLDRLGPGSCQLSGQDVPVVAPPRPAPPAAPLFPGGSSDRVAGRGAVRPTRARRQRGRRQLPLGRRNLRPKHSPSVNRSKLHLLSICQCGLIFSSSQAVLMMMAGSAVPAASRSLQGPCLVKRRAGPKFDSCLE